VTWRPFRLKLVILEPLLAATLQFNSGK
jgi:hypothetical protein